MCYHYHVPATLPRIHRHDFYFYEVFTASRGVFGERHFLRQSGRGLLTLFDCHGMAVDLRIGHLSKIRKGGPKEGFIISTARLQKRLLAMKM